MKVLVLNTGSSSIKYEVFRIGDWQSLASGMVERIGEAETRLRHHGLMANGRAGAIERGCAMADHRDGMRLISEVLGDSQVLNNADELFAIGHRVVHGGDAFREPTLIDAQVIATIRRQIPLAPLHNPANVIGIEAALAVHPQIPQVAVFDTAFHQSIPPHAYRYALPEHLFREFQIRRYGFHGTSHCYVAKQAARHLERPLDALNLITIHLGNGASMAALKNGKCVDTSMGMTPLEGLVMGTRCGDLDPAVVFYVVKAAGLSNEEVESILNKDSGLKGICGDNDMREVLRRVAEGDERAQLAFDMFTYRIKKYLGAYGAVLGRVDAVVFTAGIGENSAEVRAACCQGLERLGIVIDPEKNRATTSGRREIQSADSPTRVLVIPTDEELEIAQETVETVAAAGGGGARFA